jgi:hypothetical protein
MNTRPHSDRSSGRPARQAGNLARHLNERHPDTVLFLARHAGGQRDATHAELLAVDDTGLTVSIDAAKEPVQIAFGDTADSATDARSRLRELLLVTRAANAQYPLTILERQLGPSHGPSHPPHRR